MGKVGGNGPIDASSPNFVVTGKAIKFESNVLKNRLREPAARLSWWETSQSCRLILPFFFLSSLLSERTARSCLRTAAGVGGRPSLCYAGGELTCRS